MISTRYDTISGQSTEWFEKKIERRETIPVLKTVKIWKIKTNKVMVHRTWTIPLSADKQPIWAKNYWATAIDGHNK